MSTAMDRYDALTAQADAGRLADLAWEIHESLGEIELGKTAKSREADHKVLTAERLRLAVLATMLHERAAALDPDWPI